MRSSFLLLRAAGKKERERERERERGQERGGKSNGLVKERKEREDHFRTEQEEDRTTVGSSFYVSKLQVLVLYKVHLGTFLMETYRT